MSDISEVVETYFASLLYGDNSVRACQQSKAATGRENL